MDRGTHTARTPDRGYAAWIVAPVICALLLTGCGDDGGSHTDQVVLEITTSLPGEVGSELDTLEITVKATADASECASTETLVLDPAWENPDGFPVIALPYDIAIRPGQVYDGQVFIRVEGKQDGTVRFRNDRAASLQGGTVQIRIVISPECLDAGTDPGMHCQDGQAAASLFWREFEDLQAAEACWEEQ